MTKKVYYIENTNALEVAIDNAEMLFPCFVSREFIEMNYSQISILARNEDLACIENIFAPLV